MRVTFTDVSTEDMQRVREALTAGFEGGEEDAGELRSNTGAAIEYAYRPDREELALEVHHFPALVKEGHLIGDLYNLVNK